jgi:hypothetical protein
VRIAIIHGMPWREIMGFVLSAALAAVVLFAIYKLVLA